MKLYKIAQGTRDRPWDKPPDEIWDYMGYHIEIYNHPASQYHSIYVTKPSKEKIKAPLPSFGKIDFDLISMWIHAGMPEHPAGALFTKEDLERYPDLLAVNMVPEGF